MLLLTNDDGINAPGLAAMHNALADLDDIIVVAPDMEQSGVAHSITLHVPLRVRKVHRNGRLFGYAVNGSPADCVKLAMCELLQDKPSAVISGINYGANTGVSVLYSGTVAGAFEGAMFGLPSFAFSLDFREELDFSDAARIVRDVYTMFADEPLAAGALLNVNIPALPVEEMKGVMITRMCRAPFIERFEKRTDPRGNAYYWITGAIEEADRTGETDIAALANGYVSVTPLHYDLTDYRVAEGLGGLGAVRAGEEGGYTTENTECTERTEE
jgi:5'-nucleotidase